MNSSQINTLPDQTQSTLSLRNKAFVPAKLADDFLRVKLNSNQWTSSLNKQQHQQQQNLQYASIPNLQIDQRRYRGKLHVQFIEARLAKNYGLTRMDCYVRFNLNGKVFETDTDYSCGKNPKWGKTIVCYLPNDVDSFVLEIYDEKSLSQDEQIAVLNYTLPDELFQGVPISEWFPLSGRLGEQKEGHIHLNMHFLPFNNNNNTNNIQATQQQQSNTFQQAQSLEQFQIKEEDVKNLNEMFPSFDEDLIRSLLETNVGDQEKTINILLSISS